MLVTSVKERERLKVLHGLKQGALDATWGGAEVRGNGSLREAAAGAGVEGRRRWDIVLRLRGRKSSGRLGESLCAEVLKSVKAKYNDLRPTLACDELAQDDAVEVSKDRSIT
jgi:hypothetical protein